LALVPLLQLHQTGRLPADEDVQIRVVQQRRHLLRVLNPALADRVDRTDSKRASDNSRISAADEESS